MSTRPQPVDRPEMDGDGPRGDESRGTRALRWFDDHLFENPEICSNCFSRIRDHTEHDDTAGRLGTGNRPTETLERAGDGIVGQDERRLDDYGEITSSFSRTYCGECGSPGGRADGSHILSLQAMWWRADNIVRRLHEQGYYPDLETFYDAIETLKTNPDRQGRDREIFAAATYLAIERGEKRSGPGGLERADAMPPLDGRER